MKKLLVGVMVFAIMAVSAFAIPTQVKAATPINIYFQNTDGWSQVYCYIWQGSGPVAGTAAWPGAEMTKVEGTKDWYQLEYTAGKAFQVIFSDNAVPKAKQTGNLPSDLAADKAAYWFVPKTATTDQGTSDGLTPQGLSLDILTEAPAGFPAATTVEAPKTTATTETAGTTEANTTDSAKDSSPKTGDNTSSIMVMAAGIAALTGAALVAFKKKKQA